MVQWDDGTAHPFPCPSPGRKCNGKTAVPFQNSPESLLTTLKSTTAVIAINMSNITGFKDLSTKKVIGGIK